MGKYFLRKIGITFSALFFISIIIFILINQQPGNPYSSMISPNTSKELMEKKLELIGYYDPIYIKYGKWLGRACRLDLGYSIKYGKPVSEVIFSRVGNTFLLTGTALFCSAVFGILIGILAAVRKNTRIDDCITFFSFLGVSIPVFFVSILFIKFFSYDRGLLPASGMLDLRRNLQGGAKILNIFKHLILPVLTLTIFQSTAFIRYTRSAMIDVLNEEFVKALLARGMSYRRILFCHALKNALIPIVTIFCLQLPSLFSGALMTETVFVWPGIGRLSFEAVQNRDYPLIMGILMIGAIFILFSNFLADLIYPLIDKRISEKKNT